MNCHMEKKIVKFNRKKHKRDPWITYGILKSVNKKNSLYKKMKKTETDSINYETRKQEFNAYKSTLRRLINQAKKLYFSGQFLKQRGNGRKTWQTIDNALHRKSNRISPNAILIDGDICTNKENMANAFNKYFANICTTIQAPNDNVISHTSYLNTPVHSTFKFKTINNATTLQYLSNLTNSYSCGHDNINNTLLKSISNEISNCITLIINQSISTGSYPENLKLAKVVPIFKKNDKLEINNYRPISVLPVISKVFENVMHTQLLEYFTENNLLSSQQYGFRPNRSTELATLELMDRNIHHMNENHCPVNIYLDFSKAFDSLIYDILLSKLKHYGIQENAIQLLSSYLKDRSQYVQLDNVKSSSHAVICGIPQGSVLGPLLFNIYINDITEASTKFDFIMYADDTTLTSTLENFGKISDVAGLERELNEEMSKIYGWLLSNKLTLNTAKSKFMIFFKHPKVIPKLNLKIAGNAIEQVAEFNFLGIDIDQNITWKPHVTKTAIKISRVIGVLNKLKHIFPQHILLTIYNSLIQPHLIYGLYLWGLKCKRLKILQKKAVRILAFKPYISHSTPIFKDLKILQLEDLYTMQLYKFYYKNTNNLLPSYFSSFTPFYNNHDHNLRNNILRLPMTRQEYFVQCTKYQLLKLIRETPQDDLNRCTQLNIIQFSAYFKYSIINNYNPLCNLKKCYVCG